jgi:salicylate hydroxylase
LYLQPDTNDDVQAHRKELLDIMTSFIPIETVRFNKSLESVVRRPDKVVLTFADGEIAEATVTAGSDGIKSVMREDVLGPLYPNEVVPVYANAYAYRAVLPMSKIDPILGSVTDIAKNYFGHGRGVVAYRITGGTEMNFLFIKRDTTPWIIEKKSMTEKTSHEAMMADFEGQNVDPRLLQVLALHQPTKWGLFHHLRTSTYYRDRAILLGDAAHASMPYQAAGAAQGIEDALVLGEVLAKMAEAQGIHGNTDTYIEAGLKAYDALRRPRAQHQLERADEVGRMLMRVHETIGSDVTESIRTLQSDWYNWLWFHDLQADVDKALEMMEQGVHVKASPVQVE